MIFFIMVWMLLLNTRKIMLAGVCAFVLALGAGEATRAETITLNITSADCSKLVQHVPAPGVEYKPGVDVEGNAVAPADLGGTPVIKMPEKVHIPITVDIAKRYGIPATSNLFKPEAYIGSARVNIQDGRAWFNGQPLSGEEQHTLSRLCMQAGGGALGR